MASGRFIRDTLSLSAGGGPRYRTDPTGGVPMHRVPRALTVLALLTTATWLTASSSQAQAPAAKKGGVLRVALIGEPPTLDAHATTAVITREIVINMYEGLFALDAKYQPVPLLAERAETLDGGKRYLIHLRDNVKFHNGKTLGAADVVASLKRWGAVASPGKSVFKNVDVVEAKGPLSVEIRLKEPSSALLTILAQVDSAAVIYPKEIVDATGEGQLKAYIGTGPFKFVEHRPDRHIKLARFDGYAARSEAASGLAGQRVAHVDELLFLPVPDYATRQAGITTGEYQYIQQIKPDQYDRIKATQGVEPVVVKPYGWATIVLNTKHGLMTDKRLRQAIQAALDVEPLMLAGLGHKDFYRLDPGIVFSEQPYHSRAAAASYNQHDGVRAPLQACARRQEPARRGRLQDRPSSVRLGHRRAAPGEARALGRVQHRLRLRPGADGDAASSLRLAGLVVQPGEGRVAAGHGSRVGSQEASGDLGKGPDRVLRGGAADQDRRLFPSRCTTQGRPGL